MVKDYEHLQREWLELAPHWIAEARAGGDLSPRELLDAYMLAVCGDVTGLHILDCGCGEGRFGRMLAERGAGRVLGVDNCPPMIEAARELRSPRENYVLGDVQDLSFLPGESFDLAVSYLNQCDLPDFAANVRGVYRVLKPGGRFVVANIHPMRSAAGPWVRRPDGSKEYYILDNYFAEGPRQFTMKNVPITNFHRTLGTYLRGFFSAGFILEDLLEPTVTPEQAAQYPGLADEARVPNFIIFLLKK
ncbi:MAG TPA: class I SAM-dependent methyltransferase [Limnochordia bacterium]|nr:class I SAM-dependent methyltransferase [Limnochordia bacterium]